MMKSMQPHTPDNALSIFIYIIVCTVHMKETSQIIKENRDMADVLDKEGCNELASAARDVANSFEKLNNLIDADKKSVLQ